MTEHRTKVLILGSGPAGLTAAIYAARANLQPIVLAGVQPGGQMTVTTDVENYPGFPDVIQGPWLMERMRRQAENVGTRFVHDLASSVDLTQRPFRCSGDSGDVYMSETLVIATGASARWLGLPSEKQFQGSGVSACATCDGFFFRGKRVCVIGGGNTAVEEALYLTNHATQVTLIHRRDALRAEKLLQQRMFAHPGIDVIWDSIVEEVVGDVGVAGVRVRNMKTAEVRTLAVDGMFVAIGHTPNTALFKGALDMDENGYLITTPGSTRTRVSGVFACGDVQDHVYRQAVTAAGSGCMAALEADRFLAAQL